LQLRAELAHHFFLELLFPLPLRTRRAGLAHCKCSWPRSGLVALAGSFLSPRPISNGL